MAQEDHVTAVEYLKKSLKIRLEVYGEDHPYVAVSYNNLGYIYNNMLKDYTQAIACYQKTLEISERLFGEKHEDVTMSLAAIGRIYFKLEDYINAVRYFENAITLGEKYNNISEGVLKSFNQYLAAARQKLQEA